MKFIVAGNHKEFLEYCKENNIKKDSKKVKYLYTIYSVMGYGGAEFEFYGTWEKRKDKFKISELVRQTQGKTNFWG